MLRLSPDHLAARPSRVAFAVAGSLVLAAVVAGCPAQRPDPAIPLATDPSSPASAMPPTSHGELLTARLDNGLDVILVTNPAVPLVTIEIAVKNGSFAETPATNGLSHFYEHMFFKGNEAIPDQQAYMARMRELGISFNGYTSQESVRYFFTLPAYNAEAGLRFMYDAITSPTFDRGEMDREIGAVMGEFDRNEAQPGFRFREAMRVRLWTAYPERKDPLGSRAVVRGVTTEQMHAIQHRYYVPNNAALVVAGAIDPEATLARVREVFGGWARGADPFAAEPVPAHPPLAASSTLVVHERVQAPSVSVTWHGPRADLDPVGTYAADVLARVLDNPASKFQKALVDTGIARGVDFGYYTQAHTGPVMFSASTEPEQVQALLAAAHAEIARFADPDYLTDQEIADAKASMVRDRAFEREKVQDFAITLGFWWCSTGIDYYLSYPERIQAVGRAEIRAFLERYVYGKPYVTGVMISPEADAAALSGFAAERLPLDASPPAP